MGATHSLARHETGADPSPQPRNSRGNRETTKIAASGPQVNGNAASRRQPPEAQTRNSSRCCSHAAQLQAGRPSDNIARKSALKLTSACKSAAATTGAKSAVINKIIKTNGLLATRNHDGNTKRLQAAGRRCSITTPEAATPKPNSNSTMTKQAPTQKRAVVIAPVKKPPDPRQQQNLHEKRRDSLKNGDVFIYPPIVRRLNECHKCSRDNKICNCNELAADVQDSYSAATATTSAATTTTSLDSNSFSISSCATITTTTSTTNLVKFTPLPPSASSLSSPRAVDSGIGCGAGDIDGGCSNDSATSCCTSSGYSGDGLSCNNDLIKVGTASCGRSKTPSGYEMNDSRAAGVMSSSSLSMSRSSSSCGSRHRSDTLNTVKCENSKNQNCRHRGFYQATENDSHHNQQQQPHQVKTIYQINIVNASPDQKRNQPKQSSAELSHQSRIQVTLDSDASEPMIQKDVEAIKKDARESDESGDESCFERIDSELRSSSGPTMHQVNGCIEESGASGVLIALNSARVGSTFNGMTGICTQLEKNQLQSQQETASSGSRYENKKVLSQQEASQATAIAMASPISSQEVADSWTRTQNDTRTEAGRKLGVEDANDKCDEYNNVNTACDTREKPLKIVKCDANNNADNRQRDTQIAVYKSSADGLTCDLGLGDSIKITSAPVCIASGTRESKLVTVYSDKLMDSSSGQNNFVDATNMSSQSISARRKNLASKLSRQAIYENDQDEEEPQVACLPEAPQTPAKIEASAGVRSGREVGSEVLEYSPILSSVRDFIENVNTELQFKTEPNPSGCLQVDHLALSISQASDLELQDNTGSLDLVGSGENGDSMLSQGAILSHKELQDPQTKRSIFDGASKDEILEYLEDARERVPELLIAADDVMVISENELIVVNQLEPDLPATPISIVETSQVLRPAEESDTRRHRLLSNEDGSELENSSLSRADDKRQSIYSRATLQFESALAQSADEDTSLEARSKDGLCRLRDSTCEDSFELISSPNNIDSSEELDCARNRSKLQQLYSCNTTGTTIDSLEDQVANMEAFVEQIDANLVCKSSSSKQLNETDRAKRIFKKESVCLSSACNSSFGETSAAMDLKLESSSSIYTGRRNSTSCTTDRDRALQLRLLARDSLSSSSSSSTSSPPSSTSPSSSSSSSSTDSSNRTSGDCSATSNFYASSSLSCSSPFIALTRMSPSSPAFTSLCTAPASSGPQVELSISSRFGEFVDGTSSSLVFSQGYSQSQFNGSDALEKSTIEQMSNSQPFGSQKVDRDDSGLGADLLSHQRVYFNSDLQTSTQKAVSLVATRGHSSFSHVAGDSPTACNKSLVDQSKDIANLNTCLDRLESDAKTLSTSNSTTANSVNNKASIDLSFVQTLSKYNLNLATAALRLTPSSNLMTRSSHGHHATISRLNNYFINRQPFSSEVALEFQCLDCDQYIYADQATLMHKTNELRQSIANGIHQELETHDQSKPLTADQLDRAYIAAMNGLPLCKSCDKKRIERKEIISEFVETELKYGRDLKIIHDEFYRPMQIAGLLSKDQINGIFLNLEELIMAHCRFADRLGAAISEALSMGDQDHNTVNIGKLFVESAEMLHTFESYCIRQGSAACLLARLAKEKELLRIFLRVSQMENTLLRRMNLAAFLMVPVQRVTKYPLLLNRLYKVTAYHHKDREALRDAQLKVELHLEHINQQTKGVGATNKIWRRISNLSAPIASSHRRGLINAEDIGYIKLRKTAMDMLKWDRDETQFIHSGKINFAPLNEYLIKQKMKPIRYMAAHALLIVLGKPNWKYRPDLVKSSLDSKLMTPTPGGNGIKEAVLLLFREKNNRFVPCREPLFLSNCVLSADCSQFNSECPANQHSGHHQQHSGHHQQSQTTTGRSSCSATGVHAQAIAAAATAALSSRNSVSGSSDSRESMVTEFRPASAQPNQTQANHQSIFEAGHTKSLANNSHANSKAYAECNNMEPKQHSDNVSMSSLKSLPDSQCGSSSSPPVQPLRSFSLASALPRAPITTSTSTVSHLTKATSTTSSNLTILNQLMTKVNNYHHNRQQASAGSAKATIQQQTSEQQQQQQQQQQHPAKTKRNQSPVGQSANGLAGSSSVDTQVAVGRSGGSIPNTSSSLQMATQAPDNPQVALSGSRSSSLTQNSLHELQQQHYNHHFFHNHHQVYGDYEESFEIHERLSKESMLLRADTPLKTRYWLQMLRYHAKDLGQWRSRRNALPNIMMMRHE